MDITIRQISAKETYTLRHQVMWPNMPLEYVILSNDNEGIHFGLSKDKTIIAVISLFIKDDSAQFRKFATKNSEQGNGYGTLLLRHLMDYVSNKKIDKLWCNARADKTSFYKKFGMLETAKTFIKGDINYIIMEKVID